MLRGSRLLAAALVVAAGTAGFAGRAGAVQTTTWGMIAAPDSHGYRSSITHPADGSTLTDAVIVFNRSAQPVTVNLSVLGATGGNGSYQFTAAGTGLAAGTRLAAHAVRLGPHQQARVQVTVHLPRGVKQTTLAAIAGEAAPVNDGALTIQQRLVVFVKATPTSHLTPVLGDHVGVWAGGAAVFLLGVGALVERERRRSRERARGQGIPSDLSGRASVRAAG